MNRKIFDRNILNEVYEVLTSDMDFQALVSSNNVFIKDIPEDKRTLSPLVRIVQIDWRPSDYASDKQIEYIAEFQIDVWQKEEQGDPYIIGQLIQAIMAENRFRQSTPSFDYDPETNMNRDGRRYEGYINFLNEKENK